jgi:hypothetical protein
MVSRRPLGTHSQTVTYVRVARFPGPDAPLRWRAVAPLTAGIGTLL